MLPINTLGGGKHTEKKELFKLKENAGMRTNGYKLFLNM